MLNRVFSAFLSTSLLLLIGVAAASAGHARGHLVIIGGGERGDEIMKEFVALAGGPDRAVIVVIPMASSVPDTTGMEQVAEIRQLGVKKVSFLLCTREEAMLPETVKRLDGVTGIFFSGGDQSKLTAVVLGTPLHDRIRTIYHEGGVLGGTSAGAAIMSKVMITGDERLNKDERNAFTFVKRGNVITTEGLGFLQTVIIDQHFLIRKRHNRLLSVVLEHPHLLGVAIDEATAIIVSPDSTFRVVGESGVLVLDATGASSVKEDSLGHIGANGMALHLLLRDDRFDLARRSPLATGARP